MARKKKLITAEQLMKRGDRENAVAAKGRATTRASRADRQTFEQNEPERQQTIIDRPFGKTGKTGRELGITPKLAYRLHGIEETVAQHPLDQQELPGMTSVRHAREAGLLGTTNNPMHQARTLPDLARQPPTWGEMTAAQRDVTMTKAAQHGVGSMEQLKNDYGAQIDQGYLRGLRHGMTPHAAHFYTGDDPDRQQPEHWRSLNPTVQGMLVRRAHGHDVPELPKSVSPEVAQSVVPQEYQPRELLHKSMALHGIDIGTQSAAEAKTSPRTKMAMQSGGRTVYPNNTAADLAAGHAVRGGAPEELHTIGLGLGIPIIQKNARLAAHVVQQRMQGAQMHELTNPKGTPAFGPKTGPFANSYIDPHGSQQFTVSDIHTGGGGFHPHGNQEARETYLSDVPGVHAMHHEAARQAMQERGLHSVSGTQAVQWGEEQVRRGEVKVDRAYPTSEPAPMHGQMNLFGSESATKHEEGQGYRPLNAQQFGDEEPTGKDRDRAEAKIAAVRRNVVRKRGTPTAKDLGNEPYEGWG